MADTQTVAQALAALDQAVNDIEANSRRLSGKDLERNYDAAKTALIAAVRAEMICPQCEAHGMPSHLIPRS